MLAHYTSSIRDIKSSIDCSFSLCVSVCVPFLAQITKRPLFCVARYSACLAHSAATDFFEEKKKKCDENS